MQVYDYWIAWKKDGLTAERFLPLHGFEYPELWDLYKQIHCNTSSTAAVERSFSLQSYLQTYKRSRLSELKLSRLMIVYISVSFAREYDHIEYLNKFY